MSSGHNYAVFKKKQNELLDLIVQSQFIFKKLDMHDQYNSITKLQKRVAQDSFKIMILGEFKRGKSTFINALLGEEILPAFVTPCTAVINEIKWHEEKMAMLHFKKPLPENLSQKLPQNVLDYIEANSEPSALKIDIEQLEEYVVISDSSQDQAKSIFETPYARVEIYWPLDLCKNGVEIIDSPGLNEHSTRTKVTTEYLAHVDAVVFVLSCQALASQSELSVIERDIRGNGHEKIFFVCNRFDEVRPRDQERLKKYALEKLTPKTEFGNQGVFFLSALNALDGRLSKNNELIENSGILPLEKKLENFLVNDSGKIKLIQPARVIKNSLNIALQRQIPTSLAMLNEETSVIEKRYEQVKPRLLDAEKKREQILKDVEIQRVRLEGEVKKEAQLFLQRIINELPEIAEKYEAENKIKFFDLKTFKQQAKNLAEEVHKYLTNNIEDEYIEWKKDTLNRLLEERFRDLAQRMEGPLEELLCEIDEIKSCLSGVEPSDLSDANVGAIDRILSAAGGFVLGGVGSALVGSTLGYKEMFKSLLPNIGVGFACILVGITTPWILIPLLLATGTLQGIIKTSNITKTLQTKIGGKIAGGLLENKYVLADQISEGVSEQTQIFQDQIDEGLQVEIQSIRDQVEANLTVLKEGQQKVKEKKIILEKARSDIHMLNRSIDDLILPLYEES